MPDLNDQGVAHVDRGRGGGGSRMYNLRGLRGTCSLNRTRTISLLGGNGSGTFRKQKKRFEYGGNVSETEGTFRIWKEGLVFISTPTVSVPC